MSTTDDRSSHQGSTWNSPALPEVSQHVSLAFAGSEFRRTTSFGSDAQRLSVLRSPLDSPAQYRLSQPSIIDNGDVLSSTSMPMHTSTPDERPPRHAPDTFVHGAYQWHNDVQSPNLGISPEGPFIRPSYNTAANTSTTFTAMQPQQPPIQPPT